MALQERDLNVPHRASPTHKTPQTQSKLPRRVATPPTASNWSSSVADRVALMEKSESPGVKEGSPLHKTPQSASKAVNKPLPGEKPLPSRPIVRLSNLPSPSKDSRGLIDATEQPLHFTSPTGQKHHWPTLRPLSAANTPDRTEKRDIDDEMRWKESPSDSARTATAASVVAAAATLTSVITGKTANHSEDQRKSPSPASSYVSATENEPPQPDPNVYPQSHMTENRVEAVCDVEQFPAFPPNDWLDGELSFDAPAPTTSSNATNVTHPFSDEDKVLDSPHDPSHDCTAFPEVSRVEVASPASSDSRPHSPSPASFSRPRPGSSSRRSVSSKAMRTVSRIPIPDSKKATVIDVKKNSLPGSTIPKQTQSFGSRRLGSPEALKVLENGKMRRQLKRMPTDGSLPRVRAERMWDAESNETTSTIDTPSLSYSVDTSPNGTLAPSSPEAVPVRDYSTDIDDENIFRAGPVVTQQDSQFSTPAGQGNAALVSDTEDECSNGLFHATAPPSTSPYTLPLQTIHSEALLPVGDIFGHDQTCAELTRALSHLEGKGSPPKTDVDRQTLLHMFGHLKRSLDKNKQKSASLAECAATAEKYLAQNPSIAPKGEDLEFKHAHVEETSQSTDMNQRKNEAFTHTGGRKPTVMSKWSDSTPSDKALSSPGKDIATAPPVPSIKSRKSTITSADSSIGAISIGYPSRIPVIPGGATADVPEQALDAPTISKRRSSPTLGKQGKQRKPGSVRAAREGIKVATASFARTTASAESKKIITRMPTPNTKVFNIPETSSRGRKPSTRKSEPQLRNAGTPKVTSKESSTIDTDPDCSQTLRSRSRSRMVLDKINGIFSGRREAKFEVIPPVPRIGETKSNNANSSHADGIEVPARGGPTVSTPTPRLPKMPSMSPFSQVGLGTPSSTESVQPGGNETHGFGASQSVENLTEHILGKAQRELNPQRKARLLNFAKVLNDSLISAREAQISAETAQHAAKSAQMSYEMTQKGLALLQKLAGAMARVS